MISMIASSPRALGGMLLAVLTALFPTAQLASADMIILKDGRVFDGIPMERQDDGVLLHFENGDILVPADLVLDTLIEGQSEWVPTTEKEKAKFAKGFVPHEGKWISLKRRTALLERKQEEKREAVAEMMAHRLWRNRYQVKTKNFNFQFTVPENICAGYRERMDAYYSIFCKEWKVKRNSKKPRLAVNFYGNRKEFNRTAGVSGGVLAYFMFRGDYDLNVYYDRLDPMQTEMVLYHEANHYLQKLVNERFSYPHFPSEALAEYYGASLWDPVKKKLTVGLPQEGRMAEIQDDIAKGEFKTITSLLTEDQYEDYTWGWALVYYLMNEQAYEKKFRKWFVGLANAKDVKRDVSYFSDLSTVKPEQVKISFIKYLGLKNEAGLKALELKWHTYIEDELLTELSARGLEKAAISADRTGRDIRAKRLYGEAIEAGSVNPNIYHQYAELLFKAKETSSAIENWRKAIELEPLTGAYYWALGAALSKGDEDEGTRLKALAKELDPEIDEQSFFWGF